jgi:hypothetical protein
MGDLLANHPDIVSTQWVVRHIEDSWDYKGYFDSHAPHDPHAAILQANTYQEAAAIENHPFFEVASQDREALRLWTSQEAIVTGPFSQLLLLAAARIDNVHLRAGLIEVIRGEHNNLKDGVAQSSHPWLLHKLCLSVGLTGVDVKPLPATLRFLQALSDAMNTMLGSLGALGVGNERMLIPEYSAVRSCFENIYPDADYKGFLSANITEDTEHSAIIEKVANTLIATGADPQQYVVGAMKGVDARVAYYDDLVSIIARDTNQN